MDGIESSKHYELTGSDAEDLERRLDKLCQAIRFRSGSVLRVERTLGGKTGSPVASVYYKIPTLDEYAEIFAA
jgi:hypothetical protein